jgi:oligoribonuclease NrnB/cAMP/cGMP phosphodiesterase (DHH superfamily)
MDPKGSEKTLIIHHWDADGVCSAAILSDYLADSTVETRTPPIGTYHLGSEILDLSKTHWDSILVADIDIPKSELLELKESSGSKLFIFDHHITDLPSEPPEGYFHPSMIGIKVEKYPSSTWLITHLLKLPHTLLSILGAIGDRGPKIVEEEPLGAEIQNYLIQSKLTMTQTTRILDLLESNYRLGETEFVQRAVQELRKNKRDPDRLLTNVTWQENAQRLEKEIDAQSKMPVLDRQDRVRVQRVNSKCDIVSALGRKLAWGGECGIAVVLNTGFLENYDQLYIREGTKPFNAYRLIAMARNRGYSAGGKTEVAGIVVPKRDTTSFLGEVLDLLGNELVIPN